jgi:hypothetical protein
VHICPIAHAWPHAPQFCESEATLVHELAHIIWPAPQVTPTPPVPDGTAPTWPLHPNAAISATVERHCSSQVRLIVNMLPPSREASFPKRVEHSPPM